MTISAIVPAAGCGARAALNGNKILAPLYGKPLLHWTLVALERAGLSEIIVAARHAEFELVREAAEAIPIRIVEGGATRQESVFSGAGVASGDLVLVHDAARPLVSRELIWKTIRRARENGFAGAIAALPATDTVKQSRANGSIDSTLDRNTIWLAQTPQVFEREAFLSVMRQASESGFSGTDCASLFENCGLNVALEIGEEENFKVTFASDLVRAAQIMENRFMKGQ